MLFKILHGLFRIVPFHYILNGYLTLRPTTFDFNLRVCVLPLFRLLPRPSIRERKLTTALEKSGVATEDGAFQVVFVDDPRSVWARTCQAFQDFPARKLKTIAVTGTAGKTSASYIVAGCWRKPDARSV